MPFYPDDIYTVVGGATPYTYWNPFVTKYDTSSFYNWEQDNLPLYDLEERTEYLWAKATGYGGSSIPGMALLVSGTNETGNGRIFTNLQTAIDSIPRDIRFPICIEVVASGTIGSIHLDGITCSEKGALEIINRGCAKAYSDRFGVGSDDAIGIVSGQGALAQTFDGAHLDESTGGRIWEYVSAIDLSATVHETYSRVENNLGVSIAESKKRAPLIFHHPGYHAITDGVGGAGYALPSSNGMRSFFNTVHENRRGHRPDKVQFSVHEASAATPWHAPSLFSSSVSAVVDIHEYSKPAHSSTGGTPDEPLSVLDNSVLDFDVSAKNQQDATILKRSMAGASFATNSADSAAGIVYANTVSSIRVNNCDGPIYLRGFCVDGANTSGGANGTPVGKYLVDTGALVENSNGVVLENISTARCRVYGTEIRNSNVTISRGFYSVRNYEVTNNSVSPGSKRANVETAGLRVFNSNVSVSADPLYASGADFLFHTQFNKVGILLENSIFNAGASGNNLGTNIHTAYNNYGIKAINSQVYFNGRLDVYNNEYGLELDNSFIQTDQLTVENNEHVGLKASNSKVVYNKNLKRDSFGGGGHTFAGYSKDTGDLTEDAIKTIRFSQTFFRQNGQHILLDSNSAFTYADAIYGTKNKPLRFGSIRMVQSHGVVDKTGKTTSLPAVDINQSKADLIHCRLDISGMVGGHPTKGSAVLARNNSEVKFLGTGSGTTMIIGPTTLAKQLHNAGVVADNNSKVSFRGPTVIAQFGVDVLADNNSTMEFCPHKNDNGEIDADGWQLASPWNHTAVELHSTRACLVATNNSTITMEDLGDYRGHWVESGNLTDYAAAAHAPDLGAYGTSANHVSGSMQFYPNPTDAALTTTLESGSRENVTSALVDSLAGDKIKSTTNPGGVLYHLWTPAASLTDAGPTISDSSGVIKTSLSLGGQCVRALGGSQVNIRNVHFPCGGPNTNGTYFDPSRESGGTNNLLIWNIADTSKLNASYISVSGSHPADKSYHGPRAVHLSGLLNNRDFGPVDPAPGAITAAGHTSGVSYGAQFHPDTGRIAICDLYGLGVQTLDDLNLGMQKGDDISEGAHILSSISSVVHGGPGNIIGMDTYQNRGPFRLYFSVDSAMKQVGYASGVSFGALPDGGTNTFIINDNRPYQHLSQGYSLSGPAGVGYTDTKKQGSASSIGYQHLLLSSTRFQDVGADATILATGQYLGLSGMALSGYYSSERFGPTIDPRQIMLDESAANTFANAKNAAFRAIGDRGGPKVTIYSSYDTSGGESSTAIGTNEGQGFRSSNQFDLKKGN